jgi:chitodextrinase
MTAATATSVTVAWSPSSDNVGVRGYGVYRGGNRVDTTQTSHSLTGLSCGTAYQVGVDAYDAAGNRSSQTTLTVTTAACPDNQAPTVPTNVVAPTRTATSIALSWSGSSDNVGVVGYGLYKGGTRVAATSGTTGIFNSLSCGTNYTLAVDSYDAAGNRSPQAVVMVSTTACPDTQAPSAPSNLRLTTQTTTSLSLAWNAATDNVAVTGYSVYRGGTKIGDASGLLYLASGLACGTSYTLGVEARDAAGNVSSRPTISGATSPCTTPPPPPPPSGAAVFVATNGNDANPCTQAAPCLSLNRAYRAAQPGQTVQVACGSYGPQSIGRDGSKTSSSDVVFRPANPSAPCVRILGSLTLGDTSSAGPSHVSFVGTPSSRWLLKDGSNVEWPLIMGNLDDATLEEFDASNFYVNYAANITIRGGDYGPCTVPSSTCANNKLDGDTVGSITIENALFHNYWITPGSGEHFECMIVFGGRNIVVRGNVFRNCVIYNIFFQHPVWLSNWNGAPEHITIEGNTFEKSMDGNGVKNRPSVAFSERGQPFNDVTFRANLMNGSCVNLHDDGQNYLLYANFTVDPASQTC